MTVDIPQGDQEVLEIKASDDIERITEEFCQKHNLDDECKKMLIEKISQNLFGEPERDGEIQEEKGEDEVQNSVQSPNNDANPGVVEEGSHLEELTSELNTWKKEAKQRIREKLVSQNQPIINENSKKIVEKRGIAQVPVYERLHQKVKLLF